MENARLLTQRVDIGVCKKCEDSFIEDNDSCDEPVKAMRNKCALLINQNTHYALGIMVWRYQNLMIVKVYVPNVHICGKLFNTMKGLKFTFLNRIMMFVENKLQT